MVLDAVLFGKIILFSFQPCKYFKNSNRNTQEIELNRPSCKFSKQNQISAGNVIITQENEGLP